MTGRRLLPSAAEPFTQTYIGPNYELYQGDIAQQICLVVDSIQPVSERDSNGNRTTLSNVKLVFLMGCYMQTSTDLGAMFRDIGVKCVASFGSNSGATQVESMFLDGIEGTASRPETYGFLGYLAQGKTIEEACRYAAADLSSDLPIFDWPGMGERGDYACSCDGVTSQRLKL
jgi:hypothetical protein